MTVNLTQAEVLKNTFRELQKNIGTSIPGNIVAFDPVTQLAQVQIGIQIVAQDDSTFPPPVIIECPVSFSGGKAFIVEHQVDPGDEGIIIFSQRCIEGWLNEGKIAPNLAIRFHDINDAMFIPGVRSQPNKITSFQNNGVRLRNEAGDKYIWLKNDGTADITVDTLNINGNIVHTGTTMHTGNMTLNGDLTQTGNINQTGSTTSSVSVTAPSFNGTGGTGTMTGMSSIVSNEATINGVVQSTHIHSQGNDDGGDVEVDTGGPHA